MHIPHILPRNTPTVYVKQVNFDSVIPQHILLRCFSFCDSLYVPVTELEKYSLSNKQQAYPPLFPSKSNPLNYSLSVPNSSRASLFKHRSVTLKS